MCFLLDVNVCNVVFYFTEVLLLCTQHPKSHLCTMIFLLLQSDFKLVEKHVCSPFVATRVKSLKKCTHLYCKSIKTHTKCLSVAEE